MKLLIKSLIVIVLAIGISLTFYVITFSPNTYQPIDDREQGMYDLHIGLMEEILPELKREYELGIIDKQEYQSKLENLRVNEQGIFDAVLSEDFQDQSIKDYFYNNAFTNNVISQEIERISKQG